MQMIGEDNPGVDAERRAGAPGEPRCATCRFASPTDPNGVAQVHCKEEGSARNPIAAMTRHTRSTPDLSKRRKALRFSALRLLLPQSSPGRPSTMTELPIGPPQPCGSRILEPHGCGGPIGNSVIVEGRPGEDWGSSKRRAEKRSAFRRFERSGVLLVCRVIAAIGFRAEPSSLQ